VAEVLGTRRGDRERMHREIVLNFHGIGTPHDGVSPAEAAVWMSEERFVILLDYIAATEAEGPPILITFDDGNASDVTIALPELSKRQMKAIFFICAGRLDAPGYVSRRGVGALMQAGMEIGSHGMRHRDWRTLDNDELAEEMGEARTCLEAVCGKPVNDVAIPFGSYDRRVLDRLRSEGFACVYTSDGGLARPEAWLKPRNTLGVAASRSDIESLQARRYWPRQALRDAIGIYKGVR